MWVAVRLVLSVNMLLPNHRTDVPLFLFQTCMGSGPDAPFLEARLALLGPEPGVPLAALATSLGLGAGGMVFPGVVGAFRVPVSELITNNMIHSLTNLAIRLCSCCTGSASLGDKILRD